MRPIVRTVPRGLRVAFSIAVVAMAGGCDNPVEPPPVEVDVREILTVFYRDLGGHEWTSNVNWLADAPLDTWFGVGTDPEGNVTRLSLIRNRVTGRMPYLLGDLKSLEALVLRGNRVFGVIPPEFGKLVGLERLDLHNNWVSGAIPPELGDLRNLRELRLGTNLLNGRIPSELGDIPNLGTLDLRSNRLAGSIPREFGNLGALNTLDLGRNQLSGAIPPELGLYDPMPSKVVRR